MEMDAAQYLSNSTASKLYHCKVRQPWMPGTNTPLHLRQSPASVCLLVCVRPSLPVCLSVCLSVRLRGSTSRASATSSSPRRRHTTTVRLTHKETPPFTSHLPLPVCARRWSACCVAERAARPPGPREAGQEIQHQGRSTGSASRHTLQPTHPFSYACVVCVCGFAAVVCASAEGGGVCPQVARQRVAVRRCGRGRGGRLPITQPKQPKGRKRRGRQEEVNNTLTSPAIDRTSCRVLGGWMEGWKEGWMASRAVIFS